MEENTFTEGQSNFVGSSPTGDSQSGSAEKMFYQSDLDKLAGKVRAETEKKVMERFQNSQNINSVQPNQTSQIMPGNTTASNTPLTAADVERLADARYEMRRKEDEQKQVEAQAHYQAEQVKQAGLQIAQDFESSLEAQKHKYQDFDQEVDRNSLYRYPATIGFATMNFKEHVADIAYALQKNPAKQYALENMIQHDPIGARKEMNLLVNSIKAKESAQKTRQPNAPLSQIQPSTIGTDNGSMTMNDLKRNPRLRG